MAHEQTRYTFDYANTSNNTDLQKGHDAPRVMVLSQLALALLVLVENGLLLVIIYRKSELHTSTYFFVASLAVADLAVGALGVVGALYYLRVIYPSAQVDGVGEGGGVVHVTSLATTVFVCLAIGVSMLSCLHMAVIGVERYLYVVHPFFYQRHDLTPRTVGKILVTLWGSGVVYVAAVTLAQTQTRYVNILYDCDVVIKLGVIASVYVISTLVAGVSYFLVLREVCKRGLRPPGGGGLGQVSRGVSRISRVSRVSRTSRVSPADATEGCPSTTRVDDHRHVLATRSSVVSAAKSLKFFMVVFGIYFFMTFPAMFDMFFHVQIMLPYNVQLALVPFFLSNSGANFIVLAVVDRKFRGILLKEVSCRKSSYRCCCRRGCQRLSWAENNV